MVVGKYLLPCIERGEGTHDTGTSLSAISGNGGHALSGKDNGRLTGQCKLGLAEPINPHFVCIQMVACGIEALEPVRIRSRRKTEVLARSIRPPKDNFLYH